jgi:glycosyltransferase involved in cell wall biosynthesis
MATVSVLMAAVCADAKLAMAIESILAQTLQDFEFVIVDDSGTGEVASFAERYRDHRLRFIVNERNIGLSASLVRGSAECRGAYIARMDGDDIAHHNRLARQARHLDSHPHVGLLGTSAVQIDAAGRQIGRIVPPRRSLDIRWTLLLTNPFLHPSVMFRRCLLAKHGLAYDSRFSAAQDFDLWTRMLKVAEGANLVGPFLYYRVHAQSVTATKRRMQLAAHDEIVLRNLAEQFPDLAITPAEASFLRYVFVGGDHYQDVAPDIPEICRRYAKILARFCQINADAPGLWRIRLKVARDIWGALRRHGAPSLEATTHGFAALRTSGSPP